MSAPQRPRVGAMSASERSERPSERRGAARTAVVWDGPARRSSTDAPRLDVLDIGGGTGGFAVRVAELGHRVTVVDPSPDALAALDRRARESGRRRSPASRATWPACSSVTGPASADVVLCHGVLEVVDDPAAALATIREVLRPGGALSLLVAQRHAAVVARAMAGHFQQALALLDDRRARAGRSGRRFTRDEVTGAAGRRRLRGRRGARRPGLRRPGPRLPARPRARCHRRPGRARAGRRRAPRVPPPRHPAARARHADAERRSLPARAPSGAVCPCERPVGAVSRVACR